MVVVAAMGSTMTWWLIKGRPRQFIVICQNSLCSILFHLLVPGGSWQMVTCSPVSAANFANSTFQARTRDPSEPPPSASPPNPETGAAGLKNGRDLVAGMHAKHGTHHAAPGRPA